MYIVKMQKVSSLQNLAFWKFLYYSKKPNEDLIPWPIKRAMKKISRKQYDKLWKN